MNFSLFKYRYIFFLALLFGVNAVVGGNPVARKGFSHSYPLVYKNWEEAFLSGNGKMGIMVFGNPLNETIVFNDRKFNFSKTYDRSFAKVTSEQLDRIKRCCAEGRFKEANDLAVSSSQWHDGGEGSRHPGFKMMIRIPQDGEVRNYVRTCDFETGEISVRWSDNRGDWLRKAFVSRKDNVSVIQLSAPSKGRLNAAICLATDAGMNFPKGMTFTSHSSAGYLNIRVHYPKQTNDNGYEGVVRIKVSGGNHYLQGDTLYIKSANSVIMLCRTEKYYEDCEKQWGAGLLRKELDRIPADYPKLLAGQKAIHKTIYDRVKLDFGADASTRNLTNEELLTVQKRSKVPIPALWERLFDAGRYYFLSSASELTPPDLLGIWTGDCNAGWGGFYHLDANLNLQVSSGNISNMPEVMEGYFHLNEAWEKDFAANARKLLGCRGLLACGNSPGLASGLMASINDFYPYHYATGEEGWLLYPFWEHYLVTGDLVFLKNRLYPLLREMGYFYEDFLKYKDKDGKYIFAGSVSPENQPANLKVSLLNNSCFDISGAKFLLSTLIETCHILKLEQKPGEGVERWSSILADLPPYLINKEGAIQEWSWPGLEDNYNHRHSSHLMMVWPYRELSEKGTPVWYEAAKAALAERDKFNYENAGHGLLHSALIAAGLKNVASLNRKLLRLFKEDYYYSSLCSSHYNNHGVFCTDVCNTIPTIMMEMLVSSSPGVIELLPALIPGLDKGCITGMKGRSRVTIEKLSWDLSKQQIICTLKSDITQKITLVAGADYSKVVTLPKAKNISFKIKYRQ
ncbi:glycoside hydrolase N-terminal domain-containing protein [uncultured Bacteroides sp.]|uniref:glycosyl hydrolase family 95 catalytic domain-containing protein n=1 Tax=uncultured Bacteroides sp. TaxID=162156 RepID=UPI002AA5F329|nr:glycoside hydrolase N-terminal domain-containing protein [uncultured Bacteroides sp.]